MNKEKVLEKINDVFKEIFDDETLEVDENTTANDVEGWDSLTHINIIASVEKEFNIVLIVKNMKFQKYLKKIKKITILILLEIQ